MENLIIACFDVYYYKDYAKACCIVFDKDQEKIICEYTEEIQDVEDYISGQFYKRELPCILKVLEKVKENIDIIIIDSFIWTQGYKNGLGAYLYEAINQKIPVIGVAKSYLKGSTAYLEVYRGQSSNPLYVSAIGIDLNDSAKLIKDLKGDFRMPSILKQVDKLSRGTADLTHTKKGDNIMTTIYDDLYQFSSYIPPIDLSFHQYLLLTDEPLLVHTGSVQQAEALIHQLKDILKDKILKYIFISHFESDECGGLTLILEHFPEAKPICSEVTARQLSGFGITNEFIIKKPGEKITTKDYELEFLSYLSEMHLWEGLLLIENRRGIFFSSDLMFSLGNAGNVVIDGEWQSEINKIDSVQVPDPLGKSQLQQTLAKLSPSFIATGHGPCIKL